LNHHATHRFWSRYHSLPSEVQRQADKSFALLKEDPRHPSLHLKKVGRFQSVRIGLHHRALAVESGTDMFWFWIGSHAQYDHLLRQP
jgi:hypothetical protein